MAKIFTLINIRKVLNELTDAHIKSPVISVAGTNGKGSVAGFIASSLAAEGFSTGLYTSPHIRNFTERIKINGENISNTHLLRLYRKVTREAKGLGVELSKFEKLTGCAILYFEQEKVDVSVMEVGLGGRLDATNVCENRLVSVITKIGEDHTDFLGETIEEIAEEKAGIIKPGRPVVDASATSLIRLAAHKAGSPVFSLGKDFFISNLKSDGRERYEYDFIMGNFTIDKVAPAMSGRHQVDNSAAALACLHLADISRESMRTGIAKTRQKGRLEEIFLPGDRRLLIDVAHNPDAIIALKKYINQLERPNHLYLIMGVLEDKNYKEMAEIISGTADFSWTVKPTSSRGLEAEKLASLLINAKPASSVKEALIQALIKMLPGDLLLITGSFFILGELYEALDELDI